MPFTTRVEEVAFAAAERFQHDGHVVFPGDRTHLFQQGDELVRRFRMAETFGDLTGAAAAEYDVGDTGLLRTAEGCFGPFQGGFVVGCGTGHLDRAGQETVAGADGQRGGFGCGQIGGELGIRFAGDEEAPHALFDELGAGLLGLLCVLDIGADSQFDLGRDRARSHQKSRQNGQIFQIFHIRVDLRFEKCVKKAKQI